LVLTKSRASGGAGRRTWERDTSSTRLKKRKQDREATVCRIFVTLLDARERGRENGYQRIRQEKTTKKGRNEQKEKVLSQLGGKEKRWVVAPEKAKKQAELRKPKKIGKRKPKADKTFRKERKKKGSGVVHRRNAGGKKNTCALFQRH